jgi:hypothetical protein
VNSCNIGQVSFIYGHVEAQTINSICGFPSYFGRRQRQENDHRQPPGGFDAAVHSRGAVIRVNRLRNDSVTIEEIAG